MTFALPSLRRPATTGERERRLEQADAAAAGDAHGVEDGCIAVAPAFIPRGEEPLRGFSNDYEIDVARARIRQRRSHARERADRPEAGVELEVVAQIDLRNDLGAVRVADVGMSHGAEEDGVGRGRGVQHFGRQRNAGSAVKLSACLVRIQAQTDAGRRGHGLEQGQTGSHHFPADAVAWKDRNPKVTHHGYPILTTWPVAADWYRASCTASVRR